MRYGSDNVDDLLNEHVENFRPKQKLSNSCPTKALFAGGILCLVCFVLSLLLWIPNPWLFQAGNSAFIVSAASNFFSSAFLFWQGIRQRHLVRRKHAYREALEKDLEPPNFS